MGRFLTIFAGGIVRFWTIADGLARILLGMILFWPFVLLAFALIGLAPVTAIVAMGAIIPFILFVLISPTLVWFAWSTEELRPAIKALGLITACELLLGLYLSVVPIENNRGMVPVFVLAALTLGMFVAVDHDASWTRKVKAALTILLVGMTGMFYLPPLWKTITAHNPVPWWGFLLVGGIAVFGIAKGLGDWRRIAALATLALLMFVGWDKLYSGKPLTVTVPAVAMSTAGVAVPPPPPVAAPSVVVLQDTTWTSWTVPIRMRNKRTRWKLQASGPPDDCYLVKLDSNPKEYRMCPLVRDVVPANPAVVHFRMAKDTGRREIWINNKL